MKKTTLCELKISNWNCVTKSDKVITAYNNILAFKAKLYKTCPLINKLIGKPWITNDLKNNFIFRKFHLFIL